MLQYFFEKEGYAVRFEYVPRKMSDFVSFLLFRYTLIIKLTNIDFVGH